MVRGGDSEASEGGGCYAARATGIHGAVDLDGFLGEHPERAVGFRTCWEDPTPAMKRSAVAMP